MIKKYCEIIYRERRLQLHLVTSKKPLFFLGFLDFGPCNHLFLVTVSGRFGAVFGLFLGGLEWPGSQWEHNHLRGRKKGGAFTAGKKVNPKRVNPRNRPCTQADLKKAVNYATDTAVRQAIKMVLYVLIDKHDAPAADVQQLFDEIQWLSGHINSGAMSWGDVDRVLKENDIKIDWGYKA